MCLPHETSCKTKISAHQRRKTPQMFICLHVAFRAEEKGQNPSAFLLSIQNQQKQILLPLYDDPNIKLRGHFCLNAVWRFKELKLGQSFQNQEGGRETKRCDLSLTWTGLHPRGAKIDKTEGWIDAQTKKIFLVIRTERISSTDKVIVHSQANFLIAVGLQKESFGHNLSLTKWIQFSWINRHILQRQNSDPSTKSTKYRLCGDLGLLGENGETFVL